MLRMDLSHGMQNVRHTSHDHAKKALGACRGVKRLLPTGLISIPRTYMVKGKYQLQKGVSHAL